MSIATQISRLTTLRNNIRTKLIALGIISSSSADLEDCYDGINGITGRTSSDLTASGATVSVPKGYYNSAASKSVASGSAATPATTITSQPSISVNSSGLITATNNKTQNVTPTVVAGYVSSGTAGTITVSGSNTSQLSTLAATTYNTSASDQTIASGKYITGSQTIKAVTTLGISASNIKSGVTVKVGDVNDDDRITGVAGTFTAASTVSTGQTAAGASQVLSGYSAWVNGAEVKGNIVSKSSSDMTASGATVTAPAGYYASAASKSVASGSAATPATTVTANPTISVDANGLITATASATKSVTPTVSAGYVSTGTAGTITVSGSNTQQLTTKAATTYTPGTTNQTIASGTYLTGAQTISGDANLVAANIVEGASIFGVTGTAPSTDNALLYVEQTLTESQLAQVFENLGLGSAATLSYTVLS